MESIISTGTQIEGTNLVVRRLGIRDVMFFVKLLSKVGMGLVKQIQDANAAPIVIPNAEFMTKEEEEAARKEAEKEKVQGVGWTIISALPDYESDILGFFADLVGLKLDEFNNQPPEVLPEVIFAVMQSEDLNRFFGAIKKMMGAIQSKNPTK